MPSPKFLSGLPKPLLFGLYGAVGGFVGALVLGEPIHFVVVHWEDEAKGIARAVRLLIGSSVWIASIATPLCLALLFGQNHYLRGTLPPGRTIGISVLGGASVGAVSGFSAQFCFCFAPHDNMFLESLMRCFAWAIFGGMTGCGFTFFVPNMKRLLGGAGGAVGGGVGCIGFLVLSSLLGGTMGRLLGMTIVGFCIGVMVVFAEAVFRRAWLEVRYGERETITVNLGPEPVKVGGDAKACTVWARGAAPLALRFFVRNGEVICDDRDEGEESVAEDGFSREVGNVTVTVRTSADEPSQSRRLPRRAAKAAPRARADHDGDENPSEDSPEPLPLPAPMQSLPPVKPAIKPTTKDPNACPSCGRVIPGQPGTRYCMVCDQTY